MKEWAKRETIPQALKDQIKHEQNCTCALCFKPKPFKKLRIHHIKPVVHHKPDEGHIAAKRENLAAVCDPCHAYLDAMALEKRIYLPEVVEMQQNKEYELGHRVRRGIDKTPSKDL